MLQDGAHADWRTSVSPAQRDDPDLIGLRVRWRWTHAHMRQAPDSREFRIYCQPGHLNASAGRIRAVSVVASTESLIETNLENRHDADAYAGAWLQVGGDRFAILGHVTSSTAAGGGRCHASRAGHRVRP